MPKKPQAEFDGFRPQSIQELDDAAEEYRSRKAAHKLTSEELKTAAEELAARMEKHKIAVYRIDKYSAAVLENKHTVSIKKIQGLGDARDTGGEA